MIVDHVDSCSRFNEFEEKMSKLSILEDIPDSRIVREKARDEKDIQHAKLLSWLKSGQETAIGAMNKWFTLKNEDFDHGSLIQGS